MSCTGVLTVCEHMVGGCCPFPVSFHCDLFTCFALLYFTCPSQWAIISRSELKFFSGIDFVINMDGFILVFSLLLILEGGRSLPVDRKRNIVANVSESFDNNYEKVSFDTQGKDISESVEQFILSRFEDDNDDYKSESELSIYESIKNENILILTKIERLYNAFKSYTADHDSHHPHEIPLISIVTTEPHSMTVRIKPKKLEPDSMVIIRI